MNNKPYRIIIYSILIILIDQISKLIVLNTLGYGNSKNLIPGLFNLTLVKNTGAAFSLFSELTPLLTFISFLASAILVTIIFKFPPKSYWNIIGISYLLGGTLGNGLDRLIKGYVLDFIELLPFEFPIFNIADISINIAIVCFLIDIIRTNKNPKFTRKN